MTTKRTHVPCRRDSLSSSNRDQVTKHEMAPNGPAAISHSTAPMYRPAGRHSAWRHHSRPLYDSVHHLGRRAAVATATGRAPAPNLVARATPSIERCPKADSWRSSAPRLVPAARSLMRTVTMIAVSRRQPRTPSGVGPTGAHDKGSLALRYAPLLDHDRISNTL